MWIGGRGEGENTKGEGRGGKRLIKKRENKHKKREEGCGRRCQGPLRPELSQGSWLHPHRLRHTSLTPPHGTVSLPHLSHSYSSFSPSQSHLVFVRVRVWAHGRHAHPHLYTCARAPVSISNCTLITRHGGQAIRSRIQNLGHFRYVCVCVCVSVRFRLRVRTEASLYVNHHQH